MKTLHRLPDSRPLADAVADWLLTQARVDSSSGARTLDHLVFAVPTGEAGRRLRLALAEKEGAVIPPRLLPPSALLDALSDGADALPSPAELSALLAKILMGIGEEELVSLLPPKARPRDDSAPGRTGPQRLTFEWGVNTGAELVSVWEELRKNALSVADVAARAESGDFPAPEAPLPPEERARWKDFAALEEKLFAALREYGLAHPNELRKRVVARPAVPVGAEEVVLPPLLDAPPALYAALERLADAGVPVHVLVQTGDEGPAAFDGWGRPLPGALPAVLPLADGQIRLAPDSRHQARDVAASYLRSPGEGTVLAMLDPELLPDLESAFLARGVAVHNAAASNLRETSLGRVIDLAWTLLQSGPSCVALARFFREADVRTHLETKGIFVAPALAEFDELQKTHLPRVWSDLRYFAERAGKKCLLAALRGLDGLFSPPEGIAPRSVDHLLAVLQRLFRDRQLREDRPADRDFAAAALAVREAVRSCVSPLLDSLLDERERVVLVRSLLFSATYSLDAAEGSKPLLGWLELPWCREPRMILAGLNEGCVPEAVVGDAFLPDPVRRALGLGSNDERLARDTAIFASLLTAREPGDVEVFLEKQNAGGDVRKPSRLLFLCPDDVLPRRAKDLFRDPETVPSGGVPPVPASWRLRIPRPGTRPFDHLDATSFSSYLANPFLFYLQKTLGEEAVETESVLEIPAQDFGTLCHEALQAFAEDEEMRESEDPARIREFLEDRVRAAFKDRFEVPGRAFSAILRLQEESLLARMAYFADLQAGFRRDGWRIVAAERGLSIGIRGMEVRGKVDRIDRNADTGEYRVIDYKTWRSTRDAPDSMKASVPPAFGPDAAVYGLPSFEARKGQTKYWHDLQLPLYLLMAAEGARGGGIPAGASIQCAYCVLGDSANDSGLAPLGIEPEFLRPALEAARKTAELVVRAVQAGRFPHKTVKLPGAYARLFPAGIKDGLSAEWDADQTAAETRFRESLRSGESIPEEI